MADLENSDVVKNLLNILIDISGRKTDKGHAVFTLGSVMKKLETKYNFLKYIQIKDTRFIEDVETVYVVPEINDVTSSEIGEALQDIISTMDSSLGDSAGHFFIKEIRSRLDDNYRLSISDMGVDLSIMQLEKEVRDLEKSVIKRNTKI